jgi:hypothetical protein
MKTGKIDSIQIFVGKVDDDNFIGHVQFEKKEQALYGTDYLQVLTDAVQTIEKWLTDDSIQKKENP